MFSIAFSGIIVYYRIFNGFKKGDKIKFSNTGKEYRSDEVGILKIRIDAEKGSKAGDVGYIITGIKNAKEVKVGDTITTTNQSLQRIH